MKLNLKYILLVILIGLLINSSVLATYKSTTKTSQNVDTIDCIKIKFKDKPIAYKVDKDYWFKIITKIDKTKIIVTSNNGKVMISQDKMYDYLIKPSKNGQLILRFYENKNGIKVEIYKFELQIDE
jgi:hypothetical protein